MNSLWNYIHRPSHRQYRYGSERYTSVLAWQHELHQELSCGQLYYYWPTITSSGWRGHERKLKMETELLRELSKMDTGDQV